MKIFLLPMLVAVASGCTPVPFRDVPDETPATEVASIESPPPGMAETSIGGTSRQGKTSITCIDGQYFQNFSGYWVSPPSAILRPGIHNIGLARTFLGDHGLINTATGNVYFKAEPGRQYLVQTKDDEDAGYVRFWIIDKITGESISGAAADDALPASCKSDVEPNPTLVRKLKLKLGIQ